MLNFQSCAFFGGWHQNKEQKPMESHLRSKVRKSGGWLESLLLQKGTVPEGLLGGKKKITSFSLCKGFSKKCLVKVDDINPGFNKDWSSNTKTNKTSKTSRKTIGSDFWVMGRTSFQELFLTWPCCKENNLLGRIHLQVKDDHSSERVMYGSPKKWPWHTENLRESHILMGFQTSRFRFPKGSPSAS